MSRSLGSGNVYTPMDVEVFHFGNPPVPKTKKKKKNKKAGPPLNEHNPVAKPSHYQFGGVEVIDIAEHLSFNRGSIVKYVARAGSKPDGDELQDLKKAHYLLTREIERLQSDS